MRNIHTFKAKWNGSIGIDVIIKSSVVPDDKALSEGSTMVEDELTGIIKDTISEIFDGFPDGGGVEISDVSVTPFTEEEADEQDEVSEE